MAKIVAFSNQKGGVGKTTTCINLAAYLAAMGKRILIVDIDPQGNATSGIGIDKDKELKTIYNLIEEEYEIGEIVLRTKIAGLDIIPATVDLAGAEIDLVDKSKREEVLKHILETVNDSYDYICIDCPPSLGLLTVNALTAADSVMIPIQCEFFALEGLTQLMNTIKLIKKHLNAKLNIEGVVLTMKDNRSNLISQVSAEIHKFFGKKVFETAIPRNIRLAEAPSHGEPIMVYDYTSKGSQAYQALAEEFLMRNNDTYVKVNKSTKF